MLCILFAMLYDYFKKKLITLKTFRLQIHIIGLKIIVQPVFPQQPMKSTSHAVGHQAS